MNICLDFLVPFWCQEIESSADICHIPCLMLTFMTLILKLLQNPLSFRDQLVHYPLYDLFSCNRGNKDLDLFY